MVWPRDVFIQIESSDGFDPDKHLDKWSIDPFSYENPDSFWEFHMLRNQSDLENLKWALFYQVIISQQHILDQIVTVLEKI